MRLRTPDLRENDNSIQINVTLWVTVRTWLWKLAKSILKFTHVKTKIPKTPKRYSCCFESNGKIIYYDRLKQILRVSLETVMGSAVVIDFVTESQSIWRRGSQTRYAFMTNCLRKYFIMGSLLLKDVPYSNKRLKHK